MRLQGVQPSLQVVGAAGRALEDLAVVACRGDHFGGPVVRKAKRLRDRKIAAEQLFGAHGLQCSQRFRLGGESVKGKPFRTAEDSDRDGAADLAAERREIAVNS